MDSFIAGLVTGLLLGVSGTFLLLVASVAFSAEGSFALSLQSSRSFVYMTAAIVILAGTVHILKLDKTSSLILLMLAVLAISRQGGLVNGLVASAIAAVCLSVWFFPPIGSLMIKGPSDRLALALFLLTATLGSRLIGEREASSVKRR